MHQGPWNRRSASTAPDPGQSNEPRRWGVTCSIRSSSSSRPPSQFAGVGGLILDQIRAARAEGRRFTDDLGWTLLWALGLSVLFIAAWLLGCPIPEFWRHPHLPVYPKEVFQGCV